MDIKIVCGTWIKEADEKIIAELQAADRWLSVEELAERTGLPQHSIKRTLRLLKQQMEFSQGRRAMFGEE